MVTIIVQYKLLTGYEMKFYEWYTEMQQLVERFPGYISKEFLSDGFLDNAFYDQNNQKVAGIRN